MSSSLYGGRGSTGRGQMGGSTGGDKIPSGYRQGQMQQFTPDQMRLFKRLFGMIGPNSYLSQLAEGDEGLFEEMEAPALRQFGQMQSATASRFSGNQPGEMSGRRGSGFFNTQGGQAQEFAEKLQGQRQGLQRQAQQDLFNMSQELLGQRPQEKFLVEKQQKQNPWAQIAGQFAGAIPGAAVKFFTGGLG